MHRTRSQEDKQLAGRNISQGVTSVPLANPAYTKTSTCVTDDPQQNTLQLCSRGQGCCIHGQWLRVTAGGKQPQEYSYAEPVHDQVFRKEHLNLKLKRVPVTSCVMSVR